MNKKTEKEYFNDQWDKLKAYLKSFIENEDQEQLHNFRVQVKKVRAMLTMLDAYTKHQLLKDFKPVKKIFKQGGAIRDAYLHLKAAEHYKLDNEQFKISQQSIVDDGIQQFKLQKAEYTKTVKKAYSIIERSIEPISNKDIVDFYKTELTLISAALEVVAFDDTLHRCRRQIKILMYNLKFTAKALEGKLQVNEKYLNQLQTAIGNWHDNVLAIELFSSPELNEKAIVTKLKRQNTRLKKSIITLSVDFYAKVTTVEEITNEQK